MERQNGDFGYVPYPKLTGSETLGKAEFMNPGEAVKDRASLGITLDGESTDRLRPGTPTPEAPVSVQQLSATPRTIARSL